MRGPEMRGLGFIKKFNKENKKSVKAISKSALDVLMRHRWPGNVRELENAIERAMVLVQKDLITPKELPPTLLTAGGGEADDLASSHAKLPEIIEAVERERIIEGLKQFKTQRVTAKALGLTERILGYKIKKYGINVD